jgi:cytochrome c oxidase cbb3-type subunit 3
VSGGPRAPLAALAALLCLVLGACDSLPGRPRPADREVVPSRIMAFDALYGRNCAGCHGADGRLGAARPLNDPVYLALVTADRLRKIIAEGVPRTLMAPFGAGAGGALTDAQIDALVKAMLARWGRPDLVKGLTLPPYEGSASDTLQGGAVYARACARCHGPDGTGGPKAGSIVEPSYLALVSNQSLRTTVIAGRTDLGQPDWRDLVPGQPLTPQEISEVVAWLAAQRRPVEGRPVIGKP